MGGKTFRLGTYTLRICGGIFIGDIRDAAGGRCKRNSVGDRSIGGRTGMVATTMTEIASGGRRRLPLRGLYNAILGACNGHNGERSRVWVRRFGFHTHTHTNIRTWSRRSPGLRSPRRGLWYPIKHGYLPLFRSTGQARCVCLPDAAVAVGAARAPVCKKMGRGRVKR